MRWFLWIWTFPMSAWGSWNRKEQLHDFFPARPEFIAASEEFKRREVWTWRVWFRGFAHAAWPYILVPKAYNRDSIKLMFHEERHIHQQLAFGPFFLPFYLALWFLMLIASGFQLRKAHRWNLFEVEARAYSENKLEEHGL